MTKLVLKTQNLKLASKGFLYFHYGFVVVIRLDEGKFGILINT
jgi:hypothetical protein